MRKLLSFLMGVLTTPFLLSAPAPTSREIPFDFVLSHLPLGSMQTITVQVRDAVAGGNLIFSEVHPNVKVGLLGELDFVLGSLTSGGIPVSDFPSSASRCLDVLDVTHRIIRSAEIAGLGTRNRRLRRCRLWFGDLTHKEQIREERTEMD